MLELTINDKVYEFNFGIGFAREINKTMTRSEAGITEEIGLQCIIAQVLADDVLALATALDYANKGRNPRATHDQIDSYIDDPNTDIDKLFEDVKGFFETSNATKKATKIMKKALEIK